MTDTTTTLIQFLLERRHRGEIDRDLTTLLHSVATACKAIASNLKNGALADVLGSLDSENVQGETQKKLDVIANDIFMKRVECSGVLAAMVSEELDEIQPIPESLPKGPFVILFDPLDGSSNIDINVSVGTIFSIIKLDDVPDEITYETVLKPGNQQIAAGYALYGPSTMLFLTTGNGVDGFTFDGSIGEFRHTHSHIEIPKETNEFSINASRMRFWTKPVRTYVDECLAGKDGPRGRDFNMRWVASMVAEVHRVLLRGGVFMYPVDAKNADLGGKLRLFYEANPMAMIVEQAGGRATDGETRILDVKPEHPHQRVGTILGSSNEIEYITDLVKSAE